MFKINCEKGCQTPGYSGLNRVVNTTPNYLKADIELVRNIHLSKSKQSMMKWD